MGKLIILGCGGSAGTPAIGNWWGNCDPKEPRNRRSRPSVALQTENTLVVIDTGPDFRDQMNRENLGCPASIIITHAHSDHINGLDELRMYQRLHKREFDVHAFPDTLEKLYQRLDYMFKASEDGFYARVCNPVAAEEGNPITVGDITIIPFKQDHGSIKSMGVRVGNIGYSTDVKRLHDPAYKILEGIDIWIVDAAGNTSPQNPVHAAISDIVEMNERIGAKTVYLTHLPPTMDYATMKRELPENLRPAHDGMVLEF